MKKYLVLILIAICANIPATAQWKAGYATDEYTDEKVPQISYMFDSPSSGFIRYLYSGIEIVFGFDYSILDNPDLMFRMVVDNDGWLKYDGEVTFNFIGKDPVEYECNGYIKNTKKNGLIFMFFLSDPDGELLNKLKANNKLNIRYYDIVREQYNVISVPLIGVTAACRKINLNQ